jgi:hypothetical protein
VSLTTLGRFASLSIGIGLGLVITLALATVLVRKNRGWEYSFGARGVSCSRFGVTLWSVPWDSFCLEGYGLLGSRSRIALPDGSKIAFGEHFFEAEDRKAVKAVLVAFEVDRASKKIDWIKMSMVAVVGGVVGFAALGPARDMVYKAIDEGSPWPVAGVLLMIAACLGVACMLIVMVLALSKLEVASRRWHGSKHGPLWIDYVRSHLRAVPAVEFEEGKTYKYLDPERLKGHIGVGWAIVFCGGLLLVVTLLPSEDAGDAVLWITRAFAIGLCLAAIPSIRRDRALARSLGFVYGIEGGRLQVSNGAQTESFAATPVRTAKRLPEGRVPKFMVWWEEYANERGRIRIDRRFLWPVK